MWMVSSSGTTKREHSVDLYIVQKKLHSYCERVWLQRVNFAHFGNDPRVVESNDEGMMQQLYIFKISFLAKNDRIQTFFGFWKTGCMSPKRSISSGCCGSDAPFADSTFMLTRPESLLPQSSHEASSS